MKHSLFIITVWLFACCLSAFSSTSSAQQAELSNGHCNQALLDKYEIGFDEMIAKKATQGAEVDQRTERKLRRLAKLYIDMSARCFEQLYNSDLTSNKLKAKGIASNGHIDDGGVRLSEHNHGVKSSEYNLLGTKWGADSPYDGGQNIAGPSSSGGVVTYSFIPNGVSHDIERSLVPSVDSNLSFSSLPTYSSCFESEIIRAFAMWSAVADLKFRQVDDDGTATNSVGSIGDIRIGAHTFDGIFGTLAHAFYPPPNASTIAGDIHFDRDENWSCDSNGTDIGIVATHEIGHAIGLGHEKESELAVMNPFYNAGLTALTNSDIYGATSIYGTARSLTDNYPMMVPITSFLLDQDTTSTMTMDDEDSSMGEPNTDNPPNTDPCVTSLGTDPSDLRIIGSWDAFCGTVRNPGSTVHFYTFNLTATQTLKIDLTSILDSYLFLTSPEYETPIAFDNDSGLGLNARIEETLEPGAYVIEATTLNSGEVGNYILLIE